MKKVRGLIFVLSGPSGSGKTTLHGQLLKDKSIKLKRSISCTTRKARKGEKHGKDYFFLSRREFRDKKRKGEFLETQRVFSDYYGTPLRYIAGQTSQGRNVLLCIDVKGAMAVEKKHRGAILIFVEPPSLKELQRRLAKRLTEDHRSKAMRLKIAKKELQYKKYYDYVVINDKIDRALKELKQIIKKEQASLERR